MVYLREKQDSGGSVMVEDHNALGATYQRFFRPHPDNRAD